MISQRAAFELEYSKRYPIAAAAPGKFNIDPYGEYEDTTVNVAWFIGFARKTPSFRAGRMSR